MAFPTPSHSIGLGGAVSCRSATPCRLHSQEQSLKRCSDRLQVRSHMEAEELRVDARPQKAFFISMLVRDIDLLSAIIDLVDNSVDGARRIRGDGPLDGLWVHLTVGNQFFEVSDNCGGISSAIARQYAFKFGRPEDVVTLDKTVGRFGVGMKRALFKIGSAFEITSQAASSRFKLSVDVDTWKKSDKWEFTFSELEEGASFTPKGDLGTSIRVTRLHESVASTLGLQNVQTELSRQLSLRHIVSFEHGLSATINDVRVPHRMLEVKSSDSLSPAMWESVFTDRTSKSKISVRIIAGLGKSEPEEAGWYVFCNNRLLLEAEQTSTTGWATTEGAKIPAFHGQYAHFRGFVFFESEDPDLLPWNTTKTNVDEDSSLYRVVRLKMTELMHPVIRFLDSLKREKERTNKENADPGPIESSISNTPYVAYSALSGQHSFVSPTEPIVAVRSNSNARISYTRPKDEVNMAKRLLGVSKNEEVGLLTFDYYLRFEGALDEDNEGS